MSCIWQFQLNSIVKESMPTVKNSKMRVLVYRIKFGIYSRYILVCVVHHSTVHIVKMQVFFSRVIICIFSIFRDIVSSTNLLKKYMSRVIYVIYSLFSLVLESLLTVHKAAVHLSCIAKLCCKIVQQTLRSRSYQDSPCHNYNFLFFCDYLQI